MSRLTSYGASAAGSGTPAPPPTAPFPFTPGTLTFATPVAIDASLTDLYHLTLTGSTASIGKPTNLAANTRFILAITQDATGSRTLVGWNAIFDFGPSGIPILTTDAHATDYFACLYWATGALYTGSAEAIHVLAQSPGF